MLTPGTIVYGCVTITDPPKPKYLITLYRDATLEVLACLTTSQPRSGVECHQVKHGCNKKEGKVLSYVFLAGTVVGQDEGGKDFSFPLETPEEYKPYFEKILREGCK